MTRREDGTMPGMGGVTRVRIGRCLAIGLVSGAIGLCVGTLFGSRLITRGNASQVTEKHKEISSFVHPLLECNVPRDSSENLKLSSLRRRVEDRIRDIVRSGRAGNISVSFRDLDGGAWFSVNPDEHFVPASLLKVPVMMAILREAERDPDLLWRRVRNLSNEDLTRVQSIKPAESLEPGGVYSLGELMRRMIVDSDNNAARLVLEHVPVGALERLYADLDISFSGSLDKESFISVDNYASFFRILYNGTLLSPRSADAALALLAQRSYAGGLREGVPADVPVAAKFGEWELLEADRNREQLHDCGIVYHPTRPYLLCVMTRGPQFEPLGEVIAEISKTVYTEIDSPAAESGLFALHTTLSPHAR